METKSMPTRGRKPKSTKLKVIAGNPGKRPLNESEPEIAPVLPDAPDHLADEAKKEWARAGDILFTRGVLSNVDRAALATYCQAYARWVQAERALAAMAANDPVTNGFVTETTNGNQIQNPLVGIANRVTLPPLFPHS